MLQRAGVSETGSCAVPGRPRHPKGHNYGSLRSILTSSVSALYYWAEWDAVCAQGHGDREAGQGEAMSRAYIIAVLILGVLVRVRCGQATPVGGDTTGQETVTPVVEETGSVVEETGAVAEATLATVVLTVEATATQMTLPSPATETPTSLPSGTPTPSPITATPTCTLWPTPVTAQGVVNHGAINVRAGPGTEFAILTVARQGQKVSIIGRTEDASWVLMLMPDGGRGWGWREFIDVESSLDAVEVSGVVITTSTGTPSG